MKIESSTFVVTGGARGLGRAAGLSLAGQGARVALIDLDQSALDEVVAACAQAGGSARGYLTNVADEAEVEAVFATIENDLGPICGLVNNAGILRDGLMVKAKEGKVTDRLSLSDWQAVIDVNLTGVFLCGREAATRMIESGTQGAIINISSISSAGNIGQSNYSAAKAGVSALTVTWAKELARFGIRAAAIAPGVFETDMVASMKPEAYDRVVGAVPLGRTGRLDELADAVTYIFSNDYFSGRVLELDGGLRL
ncbi:MAG: SDR family NAD(P)-dependent oxidoreductase [Sedimenticola sp.]